MRYRRATEVTWELADERVVILDAAGSTLTTLNPVGTLIWQQFDQIREDEEIVSLLAHRFPGIDQERLHEDAEAFLARLVHDGLLVPAADV